MPASSAELTLPILSWAQQDIEQRLGFHGGRFTRVNSLLTGLIGLALTAAFFGVLAAFPEITWAPMFTQRGPTQYATLFFAFWSLAILAFKGRKFAVQKRATAIEVVPTQTDFVLSSATVDQVMQRIYGAVDDPKQFILFNRIVIALSNLRNLGRISDVDDMLRSQAEQDEAVMETSYSLVQGFVWAIPVLGFIGTVLGLSDAIGSFTNVLGSAKELSEISNSLRGVTGGLSTAFDTTLVALVAALSIQLWMTNCKKKEEELLDECAEYCTRKVVGKLKIMPFEQEGE